MRLYLVRHGEALSESADPERPLNPRGLEDVRKIARTLHRAGARIPVFFHSTKKRAKQTAEIIKETLDPRAKCISHGYLAPNDSVDEIFTEIGGWDRDTAIVGHLPFLSYLLSRLVTGGEDTPLAAFSTASVAVLKKKDDGCWTLIALITPETAS